MELSRFGRIVVVGALASTSLPSFAAAQVSGPASECAAGAGAAYQRCALWLDGRRVRRGVEGAVVAEPGFFSPTRLTRVVEGDSATKYARSYERNTTRSGVFGLLSGLMIGAAWIVADAYECDPDPTFGICTNTDDNYGIASIALIAGGFASAIVSGVLQQRAGRAASRAIFWHNANFAR